MRLQTNGPPDLQGKGLETEDEEPQNRLSRDLSETSEMQQLLQQEEKMKQKSKQKQEDVRLPPEMQQQEQMRHKRKEKQGDV